MIMTAELCSPAHYVAVNEKTSRLHRDISSSNIMMVPKLEDAKGVKRIVYRGLLCDWEMSKRINADVRAPRQPVRSVRCISFSWLCMLRD